MSRAATRTQSGCRVQQSAVSLKQIRPLRGAQRIRWTSASQDKTVCSWNSDMMDRTRVLFIFLTSTILWLLFHVSVTSTVMVKGQSDQELEAYLKRLNKPAVKTMTNKDGEVIDCVDIYKQPALDHPLLKDHIVQMKPSFIPEVEEDHDNQTIDEPATQNIESCPPGTVPIRRTQMSDLRRVASLESFGRRNTNGGTIDQAGAVKKGEGPYLGARALINVWNVPAEANEWSHSAIEISDSVKYYIEAGWIIVWQVNQELYGDKRTRLYTYWTADGYGRTGCYNLLCPGFVQVSKKFAPGVIVQPLSSYNGSQFVIAITVYKDNVNLNWWLHLKGEPVGYWPGVLFGGVDMMFQEANQVKWIGSVLNKWNKGHHTTTHMGSGYLAEEGWGKAAYFRAVLIMNMLNNFVPPNGAQLIATAKGCYNVKLGSGSILFYYGGPGGLYCA
ncbi:uncharacterized protein LOC121972611 [Zingiber officinale]|uniref:uncharacterized protein LOC121972611 n=1 Tax=Zingiber officinale TaxID=94328 RepID=UPI001C4CE76C|nr:uncharacterized protein LOC121972611 [Zingiber officinale]